MKVCGYTSNNTNVAWIYAFMLAGLLLFAVIWYPISTFLNTMITQLLVSQPTYASDDLTTFVTAVITNIPLFALLIMGVYVYVNSQKQRDFYE